MMKSILGIALLSIAGSAIPSTSESWNEMHLRVERACVAKSGMARPELLAKKISFSDAIGVEIRQLRGTDRRGRMQRLLCAYNRSTGATEIEAADAWNGPANKP